MTSLRPILGLVPARAGSKGIPGKNLMPLAGRPLVAHAIEAARASGVVDRIVLSTDSAEIAAAGRDAGAEVPFLRPVALASDEAPMLPVVLHAVAELEKEGWSPAVVVLLQPTAPLRRPDHIRAAIQLLEQTGCDAVVSVVPIPAHYAPDFALKVVGERLEFFLPEGARTTRRQDVRPAYSRDGTVYVVRRDVLVAQQSLYGRDCRPLILPRSESANLDDPEDWARAEALLRGQDLGN